MFLENDNINAHLIFPTVIYTAQLENYKEYNKVILDNIDPYNFDTRVPESPVYRMTGEHLGKIDIHHNKLFSEFFRHVSLHAKSYVNLLGMKDEVFDYFINKTWLSLIDSPETHMIYHSHSNSDISFCYYLEVPENPDCISFKNIHRPNQLFLGMMDDERYEQDKTFFRERNTANYNSFFIPPQEGLLVMWPGHLPHGTVKNPYSDSPQRGRRNGLAGDISLVLKPGYNDFESGRISLDYLRKFI
jgi:uncharacterized protein (TIGR02466 family)